MAREAEAKAETKAETKLETTRPALSQSTTYALPGDSLSLEADGDLRAHADRLWARAGGAEGSGIEMRIERFEGGAPGPVPERELLWRHEPDAFHAEIPGCLEMRIDLVSAHARGRVSTGLLAAAPDVFVRTLLEAPVAVLLGRRGFQVLHAGAIVGPRGAAVVRGPAGAGKSTLVAAAFQAGFGVLGDESVLVCRRDPDALLASVRDLTIRVESAELLGLLDRTQPCFVGREGKRRIDLGANARPRDRSARRAATLLLGPREPGPSRLVALSNDAFRREFRRGEIPQERDPGDPDSVAAAWASARSWRLDGASDLSGALALLRGLLG